MLALNRSLLSKEYTLMNVLKALVLIIFMCTLHVILLWKITLRYFTWLTKGMFCPFNVRWDPATSTMRQIDGLNLIIIDFYVLVLTPHLSCIKTSLQLSENIIFFSACHIYRCCSWIDLDRHQVIGVCHLYIVPCRLVARQRLWKKQRYKSNY
jgi:hypothetical protein